MMQVLLSPDKVDAERKDVEGIAGTEYLRKLIWQVAVFFRGPGGQLRFDGQPTASGDGTTVPPIRPEPPHRIARPKSCDYGVG